MVDWKALVHAQRASEVGVTEQGIIILRVNAQVYGYAVDDNGTVIDPDTGTPITDRDVLEPIYTLARRQMVTTSETGAKLLKQVE